MKSKLLTGTCAACLVAILVLPLLVMNDAFARGGGGGGRGGGGGARGGGGGILAPGPGLRGRLLVAEQAEPIAESRHWRVDVDQRSSTGRGRSTACR